MTDTSRSPLVNERALHTPGPWRSGGNHVFAGKSERWIASTDSPYVSASEPIPNARLIAAAPDMLAALESCVASIELNLEPAGPTDSEQIALDAARAAISKARGVSQ